MNRNELLVELTSLLKNDENTVKIWKTLGDIVKLHKPSTPDMPNEPIFCEACTDYEIVNYPCSTIEIIENIFNG